MDDKYPEFLPEWTHALEHIHKAKYFGLKKSKKGSSEVMDVAKDDFNLDWLSGTCCLTGEAFFHKYAPTGCYTCSELTYNGAQQALKSLNNLYNYKIRLAEHLKEKHPSVWAEWNGAVKLVVGVAN